MINFLINTAHAQVITASDTIVMPVGFIPDIFTMANNLFTAWEGWIAVVVGVLLALIAIEFLINAFHK